MGLVAGVWDADIEVTAALAARLIDRQFPALAPAQVDRFGEGWDNVAFLVNGAYVFRFPRRRVAVPWLEHETRILPRLAPHLPLAIPAPRFVGVPDADYPYPWAGYPRIVGTTADRIRWTDAERACCADPLARFLAALHRIPVSDADIADGPGDELARADLQKRAPMVLDRLRSLTPRLGEAAADALSEQAARLSADTPPFAEPPVWVHGDLYPRHFLVDTHRLPCGVIDWGDVHLGDPALDLSLAFTFLPQDARPAFRAAYGPIDAAAWDRAQFRAIHYGAILMLYGADVGDEAIRAAGEYALLGSTPPAFL